MKKRLLAVFGSVGLLLLFMGYFSVAHAQTFRHGDNATISSNEKIDSSVYMAGRNIDIAGEVNGDVYCVGQTITISGTIHGDVMCAGQTITILGDVNGDVRVAAQNVAIESKVANSLTVGAQNFTLNGNGSIGQDITGGVDTMTINGSVGRDLVLGAANATINGTIGRNITSQLDTLKLGSSAKVGGDINYASDNNLSKSPGAQISGEIHRSEPKKPEHKGKWFGFGLGFRIYWFFAMLLVALALVLLFPRVFETSAKRTMSSFGKTLLLGIAAVLFTPIVFILLMITVVGIPLGLILLLAWILALILSGPFFAYLIGKEIWRAQRNPIVIMLVGAIVTLLVYNIPFLGALFIFAALFIGMGMLVREVTESAPKPSYKIK